MPNGLLGACSCFSDTLLEELEILLGDQKAVQNLVGAPLEIERLAFEQFAFWRNPGVADFDSFSDRFFERRGQRRARAWAKSRAPRVRADGQERRW